VNCVRVTFEDGIVYDYLFSSTEMFVLSKSECLIKALAIAEDWRKLVSRECNIRESFVSRIEWFSYNFNFKEEKK